MQNILMNSITGGVSNALSALPSAGAAADKPTSPFGGMLQDAIRNVQGLETDASNTTQALMRGDGVDIHTAMIATQKADLAFNLALSVRNKAVAAYQQVMGMQF
jgi:flagellar hook-basal body complex protein FliE